MPLLVAFLRSQVNCSKTRDVHDLAPPYAGNWLEMISVTRYVGDQGLDASAWGS